MFTHIARILADNIDNIARLWVDELRRTERTESHNQMLTAEIVNGMKAMLAHFAEAIETRQAPDNETVPMPLVGGSAPESITSPGFMHGGSVPRARRTRPLGGPLALALQGAAAHGKLRERQGFELHELVLEYVKLRQIIWDTLRLAVGELQAEITIDAVRYIDRLLDELMLASLDSYYGASVRDLEKRAIHDPLTQLYNKDYFGQRLNEELRRSIRHSESITVAMIDMDNLKAVNDTYGHPVGDAVIRAVASAIRESCRQTDVPCRYGGDEFAVILPETTKLQAQVFAERVLQAVRNVSVVVPPGEETLKSEQRPKGPQGDGAMPLVVPVPTVSVGLACFPEDGRNPEMLVARADAALYRSKREGRNRVSL